MRALPSRTGPRLTAWGMPLGPLGANAYLVGDEASREAIVIDPGQDPEPFLARVAEEGWRVSAIFVTHAHFDHIGGLDATARATGAIVHVPAAEVTWLFDPARNLSAALAPSGIAEVRVGEDISPTPVADRASFALGGAVVRALATPGHTPGSVCYHVPDLGEAGTVFTGDTLFAGTIGRSDLPGGDPDMLLASIRGQLLALPAATIVLPGHGRASTIDEEQALNPFL